MEQIMSATAQFIQQRIIDLNQCMAENPIAFFVPFALLTLICVAAIGDRIANVVCHARSNSIDIGVSSSILRNHSNRLQKLEQNDTLLTKMNRRLAGEFYKFKRRHLTTKHSQRGCGDKVDSTSHDSTTHDSTLGDNFARLKVENDATLSNFT